MRVAVHADEPTRMLVIVMDVGVDVLIRVVLQCLVSVHVPMRRPRRHSDPRGRQHEGDHLPPGDVLAQHHPRQTCTQEGGDREDHLSSRRPEIISSSDPEHDRPSVAERPDRQRQPHHAHRQLRPTPEYRDTEPDVDQSRHKPLGQDHPFGAYARNLRRDPVVDSPAQARQGLPARHRYLGSPRVARRAHRSARGHESPEPATTRPPRCSRNTQRARITVNTTVPGRSRMEAEAASVRCSPSINSTGPATPPAEDRDGDLPP